MKKPVHLLVYSPKLVRRYLAAPPLQVLGFPIPKRPVANRVLVLVSRPKSVRIVVALLREFQCLVYQGIKSGGL